jgi:hypothetical protein
VSAAFTGELAAIAAQPILHDRIERYRKRHNIETLADAIERLKRAGLFVDAMPDGSILVRRNGLVAWAGPKDNLQQPWRRSEPSLEDDEPPSDDDVAF